MSNKQQSHNQPVANTGVALSVFVLSIVLAFLIGIISGYFIGENEAESRLSNLAITNPQPVQNNNQNETPQPAPTEDFSKYVINQAQNITIDNFYQDAETKGYAKNLIGKEMPKLTWKDQAGTEHSTDELGDTYIVELFGTTCTYCQASVPEVDKFRENNPEIKIVSLTPDPEKDGALDLFNVSGENAFYWTARDNGSDLIMSNMPWVPGFIFVEDGMIKLVSYGGTDEATLKDYSGIAFE